MKFLPSLRPLPLLALALSLTACSTASNRRQLYNTVGVSGPWHDYSRRLEASGQTGVAPTDMGVSAGVAPGGNNTGATTTVSGRATRTPKSTPVPADPTVPPSAASGVAPGAAPAMPDASGLPATPSSPTSTDGAAPAAPGGATTAPAEDPSVVPANPPTT